MSPEPAKSDNALTNLFRYVTEQNTVTFLVLLLVVVGLVVVATGGLALEALVKLLSPQVAALAAGAGLASIRFVKAPPGTPILGIATVLIIGYAITGAIQVLASDLTFEAYLKILQLPVAGLAIGKGLFANNGGTR